MRRSGVVSGHAVARSGRKPSGSALLTPGGWRHDHTWMRARTVLPFLLLIASTLLAAWSPAPAGVVADETEAVSSVAEQDATSRLLVIGPDVCPRTVRAGRPLPCPCDADLAPGCGSDRVPHSATVLFEPLLPSQRQPIPADSPYGLYYPQLSSPPPKPVS